MERKTNLILLFLFCLISSGSYAEDAIDHSARVVDPFHSFEEAEEALRTAEIIDAKELGTGITHPLKLYLQKDTLKFKAVFKSVNDHRQTIVATKFALNPQHLQGTNRISLAVAIGQPELRSRLFIPLGQLEAIFQAIPELQRSFASLIRCDYSASQHAASALNSMENGLHHLFEQAKSHIDALGFHGAATSFFISGPVR